jgi:hypothetical protein
MSSSVPLISGTGHKEQLQPSQLAAYRYLTYDSLYCCRSVHSLVRSEWLRRPMGDDC